MESHSDTRRVRQLIYGGEVLSEEDYESILEKIDDFPRDVERGCRKPSLYLQLFEDMINTVYEHESHLLSQNEWDVFATLKCYCYNARYCLVRLVLRKPDQWHALLSLDNYKKEVGEVGLIRAVTDLCRPWQEVMRGVGDADASSFQNEVQGDVDDSVEETTMPIPRHNNADPGPSNTSTRSCSTLSDSDLPIEQFFQENVEEVQFDSFCYDESTMNVIELLNRLSVQQLKKLVKDTKSRPSKSTKPEIIRALLSNAATQTVLQLPISPMNERLRRASEPCLRQAASLAEVGASVKGKEKAIPRNQEQRLVQMVLKMLGKCVKVNGDFYRLVRRLHLICFRCTEQPTSLLLPALLTSFKKRVYPRYEYKRDKSIWPGREDLLAYEEALELETHLEEVMTRLPEKDRAPKTPGSLGSSVAPATPIGQILRTLNTPFKTPKDPPLSSRGVEEAEELAGDVPASFEVINVEGEEANILKAKRVKELLYDKIYPRWKESIEAKSREGCSNRKPSLDRFEPGYIYTRMLHHATRSLATLKAYEAEYEILQALLGQKFYRRGSRARWYERRAIIQTMYLSRMDEGKRDQNILRQAMDGVKEALLDDDTGIVWRPGLLRRLQRLEKTLQIPDEERSQGEGELKQPQRVFIKAARAMKRSNSASLEDSGRSSNVKSDEVVGLHTYFTPKNATRIKMEDGPEEVKENGQEKVTKGPAWKGKSLWIGRDSEEVYVEIRALQYYENLGFKGFHAETRILTTIFSLLFWDIIFTDIPGAFETPYQTAPLDLAEDTFYYARKDMIEARLEEIRNGGAREILELRDEQHREKQTMCIGLRWDVCERSDLVQIVECLGGHSLALICRLFCEDYSGRSSGVPDLVIWCAKRGICKFVEVKGPGDRPQENQKLWFDSLLRAKADVEICHVIDINAPAKEKLKTPGTTTRKRKLAQPIQQPDLESDDDDNDRHGYDGEASILRGDYTSSSVKTGAPRKRRKKTLEKDELPNFSREIPDDSIRLDRHIPDPALFATETPSKRVKKF